MTHLEANIIGNELILTWSEKGRFHSGITFEWRNLLIHLKVDVETGASSRTDAITININGEITRFGVGRSTVGAGSLGKKPDIETATNFLSISQSERKVILKDNIKDGNFEFLDNFVFRIINIPNHVLVA